MATIDVLKVTGGKAGSIELDDGIFGIEPNVPVMHQVVNAQLAAKRAGTHSTKTRAEVRGGGAKPWKQKGTGRARVGSSRVPQWRGGGVAMGPKPRDYSQRTPKKMKRLALYSALSDRASENNVLVVEGWSFEQPKTKEAKDALSSIGAEGKVLLVIDDTDTNTRKSFRNLTNAHVISPMVIFTKGNLPTSMTKENPRNSSENSTDDLSEDS